MAQQPYGSPETASQRSAMASSRQSSMPRGTQSRQVGGQGQMGQQPSQMGQSGGMAQQPGGGTDATLEEAISNEMRVALHDFVRAVNVCEWCAERCIDAGPEMAECVRLCRDVADIASLNVQLLARDSVFGPAAAEVFAQAAEACARECAQHPEAHCQECAEVLPRAARSTREMLASFGSQGAQSQAAQSQATAGGQF